MISKKIFWVDSKRMSSVVVNQKFYVDFEFF